MGMACGRYRAGARMVSLSYLQPSASALHAIWILTPSEISDGSCGGFRRASSTPCIAYVLVR